MEVSSSAVLRVVSDEVTLPSSGLGGGESLQVAR